MTSSASIVLHCVDASCFIVLKDDVKGGLKEVLILRVSCIGLWTLLCL